MADSSPRAIILLMHAPAWVGLLHRLITLVMVALPLVALFRRKRRDVDETKTLVEIYGQGRVLTQHLPEFQFITHQTTVTDVIDKLGPPSRVRNFTLNAGNGVGAAGKNVAGQTIAAAEYALPYNAAVIVMPEYPCDSKSKIRAVFYRAAHEEVI